MRRQRKQYFPEEKVAILRRHLIEKVPVSRICDEYDLKPTVYYRWQKQFFEQGALVFQRATKSEVSRLKRQVAALVPPSQTRELATRLPCFQTLDLAHHLPGASREGQPTNKCT